MSCSLEKGQNENEICVIKPYVVVNHISPVQKRNKQLDLTKYKKKMSCSLEKLEIKSTSGFLPVKKNA